MTDKQPEALRLADLLLAREHAATDFLPAKAAAELRRMHAENAALLGVLRYIVDDCDSADYDGGPSLAAILKARAALKEHA